MTNMCSSISTESKDQTVNSTVWRHREAFVITKCQRESRTAERERWPQSHQHFISTRFCSEIKMCLSCSNVYKCFMFLFHSGAFLDTSTRFSHNKNFLIIHRLFNFVHEVDRYIAIWVKWKERLEVCHLLFRRALCVDCVISTATLVIEGAWWKRARKKDSRRDKKVVYEMTKRIWSHQFRDSTWAIKVRVYTWMPSEHISAFAALVTSALELLTRRKLNELINIKIVEAKNESIMWPTV